jgi:type 1 fimbria pilin
MNCLMRRIAVLSLWVTALTIAPNARATFDGTVTFLGAITVPTCAVATSALTATESIPAVPTATQCTSSGTVTSVQYTTRIEPIADSERERLLSYFRNYLRAAHPAAKLRLITNVYD